jgi:shikimate kinase
MKHIILIGFKHVGKSVIGHALSEELTKPFVDLDRAIEKIHSEKVGELLSCRQIAEGEGLKYFRDLEAEALSLVLENSVPCVIAPGGGIPMRTENQSLLREHIIVHVTADKNKVFERIMVGGRPAFFPKEEEPIISFMRIWDERMPMYEELADHTITNNALIHDSVREMARVLQLVPVV